MIQRKMVKYKLVHHHDINKLENEINRLLKNGWELCGSAYADSDDFHYQPMALYDDSILSNRNIDKRKV